MRSPLRLCLIIAALAGCGAGPTTPQALPSPAVPVTVAAVQVKDVPWTVRAIGQVQASQLVTVRPQVGGPLRTVLFKEGDLVTAGQPLFTIDPRPAEQALLQAQANHQRSLAEVRQAEAVQVRDKALVTRAKNEAQRSTQLVADGMVTPSADEQTQITWQAAQAVEVADEASVAAAQATVAAAAAAIEDAKLQLSWCQVTAPIAGRTGALAVDAGNIVVANQTALVTIAQVQPIHVTFTVPEPLLGDLRTAKDAGTLSVTLTGSTEHGQIDLIDNQIDPTTGTIRLRAVLANAEGKLWPGQFADLVLTLGVDAQALVVPVEALQSGQQGRFVYVVQDGAVALRPVHVVRTNAGEALLAGGEAGGVAGGDQVVTDGQLKLVPGAKVTGSDGGAAAPAKGKAKKDAPAATP